jgi:PAS domain S-box-containing protein
MTNHRYVQALDKAQDALYIVTDGTLDVANSELVEMTGYPREELQNEKPTRLFHENDRKERSHRLQLLEEDSDTESVTWFCRFVTKHGTELPVELHYSVLASENEEDTEAGYIGRVRDVREQNQQEQKLDILNRALRHNIRNRMNIVVGNAVTLQEIDDPNYRTAAETIEEVGEEVINLSEKARKAQKYLDIPPDEQCQLELVEVTEQVIRKFDIKFADSTVSMDAPEHVLAIAPPSYEVALMELMENACVHHSSGHGPVEISMTLDDGTVTVRVRDECEPIPDDVVETVKRGEEQPLKHNDGLGLWIVKWMVDAVESDLQFGRRTDGTGNEVTLAFEALAVGEDAESHSDRE